MGQTARHGEVYLIGMKIGQGERPPARDANSALFIITIEHRRGQSPAFSRHTETAALAGSGIRGRRDAGNLVYSESFFSTLASLSAIVWDRSVRVPSRSVVEIRGAPISCTTS